MAVIRLVQGTSDTDQWGTKHALNVAFSTDDAEKIKIFQQNPRYEVVETMSQLAGHRRGQSRPGSRRDRQRAENLKLHQESLKNAEAAAAPEASKREVKPFDRDSVKLSEDRLVALTSMKINEAMSKAQLTSIARDLGIEVPPEQTKKQLVITLIQRQEDAKAHLEGMIDEGEGDPGADEEAEDEDDDSEEE